MLGCAGSGVWAAEGSRTATPELDLAVGASRLCAGRYCHADRRAAAGGRLRTGSALMLPSRTQASVSPATRKSGARGACCEAFRRRKATGTVATTLSVGSLNSDREADERRAAQQALQALLRPQPDRRYPLRAITALTEQPRNDLLRLVEAHQLSGWALRLLKDQHVTVPAALAAALQKEAHRCRARSIIALTSYSTISTALTTANVPHIPLKGIALLQWLYPDPGLRNVSDIDMLVQPKDVQRAHVALEDEGWRPDTPQARERLLKYSHHSHYQKSHSRGLVPMELHWRFSQGLAQTRPAAEIWNGAMRPDWVDSASCERYLDPSMMLYSLLLHLATHLNRVVLKWVIDILVLTERAPESTEAIPLLSIAKSAGTLFACCCSISYVARLTGADRLAGLEQTFLSALPPHRARLADALASSLTPFGSTPGTRSKWATYALMALMPDTWAQRYRTALDLTAFKFHSISGIR